MTVHTITFDLRPAPRPRWYELRPFVDGTDFCELVRAAELPLTTAEGQPELAGNYSGVRWPPAIAPEKMLRHFLGEPPLPVRGRTPVLACECGEFGCWDLVCRIDVSATTVQWSDFLQPYRSGDAPPRHSGYWSYEALGAFVFARGQYEQALRDAIAQNKSG